MLCSLHPLSLVLQNYFLGTFLQINFQPLRSSPIRFKSKGLNQTCLAPTGASFKLNISLPKVSTNMSIIIRSQENPFSPGLNVADGHILYQYPESY